MAGTSTSCTSHLTNAPRLSLGQHVAVPQFSGHHQAQLAGQLLAINQTRSATMSYEMLGFDGFCMYLCVSYHETYVVNMSNPMINHDDMAIVSDLFDFFSQKTWTEKSGIPDLIGTISHQNLRWRSCIFTLTRWPKSTWTVPESSFNSTWRQDCEGWVTPSTPCPKETKLAPNVCFPQGLRSPKNGFATPADSSKKASTCLRQSPLHLSCHGIGVSDQGSKQLFQSSSRVQSTPSHKIVLRLFVEGFPICFNFGGDLPLQSADSIGRHTRDSVTQLNPNPKKKRGESHTWRRKRICGRSPIPRLDMKTDQKSGSSWPTPQFGLKAHDHCLDIHPTTTLTSVQIEQETSLAPQLLIG